MRRIIREEEPTKAKQAGNGKPIPLVTGRNVHSLWDGLLGRTDRMAGVACEVEELKQNRDLGNVDTKPDVSAWINDSRQLAESFAYDPVIVAAVQQLSEGHREMCVE